MSEPFHRICGRGPISGLAGLALPLLHALEPERAHELTLCALETGLHPRAEADDPRLAQTLWGLDFPNPVGVAAGFDKDARVPDALLASGFGFAEAGTVTPKPQPGSPRPRVFRLSEDRALINRLGFNSGGHAVALARLKQRRRPGVVGVNIGANKDAEDKTADYVKGLETFWSVADYFTVNISSPNTPGLRDLQAPQALDALLARAMETRERLAGDGAAATPILVKLAPDIADEDLPAIVETLLARKVDGIIVSNTTLARGTLKSREHAGESGGLSGPPLFARSTSLLARVYVLTEGRVPLIGVGGVDSGAAALAKIEAGASLVQLYTGLVYHGPALLDGIKRALLSAVERAGAPSLGGLLGGKAREWADAASGGTTGKT